MAKFKAADLHALPQGLTGIERDGRKLLLVREGHEVRAFQGTCPHAGADLARGVLCDGRIICPWHAGAFDSRTGDLLEPVPLTGLRRHFVSIVDGDVMVETDPAPVSSPPPSPDPRVFVLVGAGAASASAATTLRDGGFGGRIVLIGPDAAEPLDRTQLSKMALAQEDFDRATLPLFDAETVERLRLERICARVTAIDPATRHIGLSTGEGLRYDAAMLATGARPLPLSLPGGDLPHVRTLRTLADVDGILKYVRHGAEAVVIGASFIGMEVASDLVERGMHVTVIGQDPLPFAKQFGPRVGAAIRALHEDKGVSFRLDAAVERITSDAVILKGGETLPAVLVVAGLGAEPVLDYAPDLRRADDGGFATDGGLRVSDGLWAAGDIASPAGWPRIEHWRLAQQHGRVAAMAMLGVRRAMRESRFSGPPSMASGCSMSATAAVTARSPTTATSRGSISSPGTSTGAASPPRWSAGGTGRPACSPTSSAKNSRWRRRAPWSGLGAGRDA